MSIRSDINQFIRFIDSELVYIARAETKLSGTDLDYIHEIAFLRLFRGYEEIIEKIFLNAMCRNESLNGVKLDPWIRARDKDHALELLKLEKEYVDWDSPANIITRSEIIFNNPQPLKAFLVAKQEKLQEAKKIRNYIAHNSKKSKNEFDRVYMKYYGAMPALNIDAGEFLKSNVPRIRPIISFTSLYASIFKEINSII